MQQTTTAELFFDLVYVFAVTQLSVQELLYALVNEVPAPTPVEPFAFLVDVCSRVLSPRWSRRRSRSRARRFCGARVPHWGPVRSSSSAVERRACSGEVRRETLVKLTAWRPVRGESVAHSHS